MLDNEQQTENTSDVGNSEVSSEPQIQSDKPDSTPFHEHPRFRELVEQKNKYAESYKTLEQQYKQMAKQLEELNSRMSPKKEEDPLVARLKGIDPEFGERFEKLSSTEKELAELRQWREQMEMDRIRTSAVNTVSQLHTQNKVPAELQEFYNEQLEAMYARNPQAFLSDINSAYKTVHDRVSKILESRDRATRESYVSAKKADSKAPSSQPKGKPVNTGQEELSSDPEVARKQVISRVLKHTKASSTI